MKALKIIGVTILLLIAFSSYSAVVVINQSGFRFSPSSLTVNVGDVVKWVWASDEHTTTSISIPSGAQSWDSPLSASNTSFEYTVTVAGSYSYKCTPHESMGMTGSFTAIVSTNIDELDLSEIISIYPNPAFSFLNIKTSFNGDILLSDVLGKSIRNYQLKQLVLSEESYKLDLNDLAEGIYIISFLPSNSKKRTSLKFIKK